MLFMILTLYRSLASMMILLIYLTWLGPTTHGCVWAGKVSALSQRSNTATGQTAQMKSGDCEDLEFWLWLHFTYIVNSCGSLTFPWHWWMMVWAPALATLSTTASLAKKNKRWFVREGRGEGGQGEYEEELKHLLKSEQFIIQLTGNWFVLCPCPVYFLSSKK